MSTKHSPATQLPWRYENVAGLNKFLEPSHLHMIRGGGNFLIASSEMCRASNLEDLEYIAHAANAYPRLVEALQHTLALSNPRSEGQRYQYDKAYNLLRELGEE